MMSETSWGQRKYRTTNWKAYNAALKARGDLTIWLDKNMQWLAPPSGKQGRSKTFSDAGISFASPSNACLACRCVRHWGWCSSYSKWRGCLGPRPTTARCAAGTRAWMCKCTTAQAATACICLPTLLASSSWAKVNGKQRSMKLSGVASGAGCIWALMQRLCRYEPLW